ncbi:MAG: hypothetical protein AAB378_01435 [Patescibacteria group bacterium]
MEQVDPRSHFVVVTGIIVKDGKFLIAKRAPHEKAYPDKWTVPGGKLVTHEYKDVPKTTKDAWYNIVEWVLRKEIKEEVNLEIANPHYLCDLIFMRPDGYPVVTLSYWGDYKSGEVKLCKDLTEHAWVTLAEARNYDLIDGIWHELELVDNILRNGKRADFVAQS